MKRMLHKTTPYIKRLISMVLVAALVGTMMPAVPVAYAAGDRTGTISNNAEVSYDRNYTTGYAEFNALNKKATPVNLILLVDKGITGSSLYPTIKSIIEDNFTTASKVTAGKFALNAGSRLEIIQYTANVTTNTLNVQSDDSSDPDNWKRNVFSPTYGSGNSDEVAALQQAITAVQTAKEQNDNPTAVLWVLGEKFNRDETEIEAEIKALKDEFDTDDAFMTWQYADTPTELLSTHASEDPTNKASAYASKTDFRSGLLDTLKKITSDSLKDDLTLNYSKTYTVEGSEKVGNYIVDAEGSAFITALTNDDTTGKTTTASITVEAGAPSCKDHTFTIGVNLEDNFDPQDLLPEQGPYTVTWNTGFWDLESETQTYQLNSVSATIPSYTLTYDIDEDQMKDFGIDEISKRYRQNTKIYLPKPDNIDSMYQNGLAFSGWVDEDTGASYSPGDFFDVNKDTTLVPAWGKIVVEKYIGVVQDVGEYSNVIAEDVRDRLENTTVSGFLDDTTSITFENVMPSFVRLPEENNQYAVKITDSEYDDVVYATNIGENGSVVILAFKLAEGSTDKYEAFIYAEGGAVASSGFKDMFYNDSYLTSNDSNDLYPILETIQFNGYVDTSTVTDMSGLFKNLTTLEKVDVKSLDTTNVTNMSDMFRNVGVYTDADPIDGEFLNSFVTSTVTDISGMFASDGDDYKRDDKGVNITNIDLSSWDTSNVTDMSLLFKNYEYTVAGLEGLNVSKVNNFSEMFFGTLGITDEDTLDLSNWNIFGKTELISDRSVEAEISYDHHSYSFKCNVTLGEMFQEAVIAYNIKLATSDAFSSAAPTYVHVDEMFRDAEFLDDAAFDLPWAKIIPSYRSVADGEYPNSGETVQYSLIAFAKGAENIDQTSAQRMISEINVEGVKWLDLCSIFEECTGITSIDMSEWELTCADMGYSFGTHSTSWSETSLTHVDLPIAKRFGFINNLFMNRKGLETITYPNPDSGEIIGGRTITADCDYAFYGCSALTTALDFSHWNWGNFQSMDYMFKGASSVKTIILPESDKLADDGWVIEMFSGCTSLTGKIDLSGLKNARTYISGSDEYDNGVFEGCINLEEVDLSGWELSTVSLWNMFKGCTSLEKVDLSGWINLNNLRYMQNAFYNCQSLTEVIFGDAWNRNIVTEYEDYGTKQSNKNISATSMAYMFYNCSMLESIDMTGFSVTDVSTFNSMFSGCTALTSITLDQWETDFGSNVNMNNMFSGVSNATLKTNVAEFKEAWTGENGEIVDTEGTAATESALEQLPDSSMSDSGIGEASASADSASTESSADQGGETASSVEADAVDTGNLPEQLIANDQNSEFTSPASAFSADLRNTGAASNLQDDLPVYGMALQNTSDLTRSTTPDEKTPDAQLTPQTRTLVGGSDGLYTNSNPTEVGTQVDYIVLVRYEGSEGGLSGKVQFTDNLPDGLSFVENADGTFKYDVGAVDGYTTAAYQDSAEVTVSIDKTTGTLTGTCDNLLAGNYVAITFTCEITGMGEPVDIDETEYWIWDNTATATDGKTSDSSATIRLWYTLPDESLNPNEPDAPDLAEHAVTYVYRGEIPEGITVPETGWYQAGEAVIVPDVGIYEGYSHSDEWVSNPSSLGNVSATSSTTFTMPDENVVLMLDWEKDKSDKTVTIQYVYEGEIPDAAPTLPESMTFSVGELVNIFTADTQIEGYTLSYNFDSIKNWELKIGDSNISIVTRTDGSCAYQIGNAFHELVVTDGEFDTASLLAAFGSSDTSATLTLKCKYTPLTGTIKFDENTEDYVKGYMWDMTGLTIEDTNTLLNPNGFERTGYTFAGWSLTPGENQTIVRGDQEQIGDILKLGKTVTLYAQWVFSASSLQLAPLTVYGEDGYMDYKLADQMYIYSEGDEKSIIPSSTVVTLISDRPAGFPDRNAAIQSFLTPRALQNSTYKYLHNYSSAAYRYMLNEFGDKPVTYLFAVKDGSTVQGGYDKDDIYYNDKNVTLIDSSLRVRYVNNVTQNISQFSVLAKNYSTSNESSIESSTSSFGALLPEDTELYVNDYSSWSTSNTSNNIRLLTDKLLSTEESDWGSGESNNGTISSFIEAAQQKGVNIASDRNEFRYIDLIDTKLGNAWITSTEGVKVYWPYPGNVGESNKDTVQLIRFTGLNREYGMDGDGSSLAEQLAHCTVERVPIEDGGRNGFWFEFDGDGAAIYAITWGEIPNVTVNFDDQIPGGDNDYYATLTLERVKEGVDTGDLVDTAEYQTVRTPVYEGHIFKGWFTGENGQGDSVEDIYIGLDTPVESVITLYAYWIPDVDFTVHFEPNNGDVIPSQSVQMSDYLEWVDDGEDVNTFPFKAVTGNWENDGKILAGWALDLNEIYTEVLNSMDPEDSRYGDVEEELAKTQNNLMRYKYLTEENDVSLDAIKEAMDKILEIQDDCGVSLSEITIYAMWLEDTTYTIHFDTHSSFEIPSQSVKLSEMVLDGDYVTGLKDGKQYTSVFAPEIEGYTAEYWYLDIIEVYSEVLDLLYQIPEADRVPGEVNDEFSWNYWVAYIEDLLETYKSNPQYSKQKVSYDDFQDQLSHAELLSVLATMYQLEQLLSVEYNNITVHLSWGDNAEMYTLTYHANDGSERTYSRQLVNGSIVTVEDGTLFRRVGYVLTGWNTEADGTGESYAFDSKFTMPDKQSADLYAVWEEEVPEVTTYQLTYVSNGGTEYPTETYNENTEVTLDKTPTRAGYTFEGWYADKQLTQHVTKVVMDADKTVYAGWQKNENPIPDPDPDPDTPDPKPDPKPDPDDTGVSDWLDTQDHRLYLVGYPDITFRPGRNMTRAEVAQMFYALLLYQDVEITTSFSDVPEDAWYTTAVNTLASLGMLNGYPDGTFRPDDPITRAEFTTVALAFAYEPEEMDCSYYDVFYETWYYPYVAQGTSYDWISGYPDGTFRPENYITRAEVTVIVNNMLGRVADKDYVDKHDDEIVHFVDLSDNYWAYYTIMEATNTHEYTSTASDEIWTAVK